MLLVPASVLRPQQPDEHFAAEAAAARAAGLAVALVDHDALCRAGGAEAAVRRVRGPGTAVYRGWMLRGAQYAAFEEALRRRGVTLRTTAAQYRRAHELPGWHARLAALTPAAAWTVGDDRAGFEQACRALGTGPAVLRDYTKSVRDHWHDATFVPDVADRAAAWVVATRFRELRGDAFDGGFVLRRFEEFTGPELRTWWVRGTCPLTGPHPDTPGDLPSGTPDLAAVAPLLRELDLPFVTADFVRRTDGAWRLVELGDGQVSDRPGTLAPGTFAAALLS